MTFDLARNTKEAEDYLKQTRYAVVISDFYRTDDPIGGYTLLEAVKRIPNAPPYIIYSESARPDLVGEAKAKGAFGETNNPQQLFDMRWTPALILPEVFSPLIFQTVASPIPHCNGAGSAVPMKSVFASNPSAIIFSS